MHKGWFFCPMACGLAINIFTPYASNFCSPSVGSLVTRSRSRGEMVQGLRRV